MPRLALMIAALIGAAWLGGFRSEPAAAQVKKFAHPRVHQALRDLRLAQLELREGKAQFGGHRTKALAEVDKSIAFVDKALRSVGETIQGAGKVDPAVYKQYATYPHMQHALRLLRDAHADLKSSATDFNGLRRQALAATDQAIVQIEKGLAFAANKK